VQSYNFSLEQEVAGFVLSGSYVGTLGRRLSATLNLNASGPGTTANDRPLAKRFGRTADTNLNDYMVSSAYHGLQTRAQRRFGRAGSLTVSYTWSKSLDYTDAFTIANPLNIDINRGLSSFDRAHNFVFSHVTALPFGRGGKWLKEGVGSAILGGFRISGVLSLRTGTPVNVIGVRQTAANSPQGFASAGVHPSSTGPVKYLYGTGRGELWFDTSTFVEPYPGTYGTVGRNTVRGPGYRNYNATLSRTFRLAENYRLQFTLAAFNVTNSTHFNEPSGTVTSGNFGQIVSSFGERQVRIGAKVEF
jgi:hypothetical protein